MLVIFISFVTHLDLLLKNKVVFSANEETSQTTNESQTQQQPALLTADDLAHALSRATRLGATYGVIPSATFKRFLPDNQRW